MNTDLLAKLREEALALSSRAWNSRCGSPDCGIASNLASEAADAIERLESEIKALQRDNLSFEAAIEADGRRIAELERSLATKEQFAAGLLEDMDGLRAALQAAMGDAKRLEFMILHPEISILGDDHRGWLACDRRNGLTIIARDYGNFREACDAAMETTKS